MHAGRTAGWATVSVRLSADEAWQVIEASHTGVLTTLRADGSPVALPVWFVVMDRTICFGAPTGTKKISRIRRDPRASFLVESGERWAQLRAVHLSGAVEVVDDDAERELIAAAIEAKYHDFQTPSAAMPAAAQAHYAGRTFLRLRPQERFLSWDNSRMELRPE
jgi:PPOX class probable F420-dependent enzyme